MKRIYKFSIILIAFFVANSALATVGGPTFIHSFKYNPLDESVYYIQNSESGRGCPPELMKLSLNSGKVSVALSCDQGEKIIEGNGYEFSPIYAEIERRTQNFKSLTPINLKDNRISIDISFVNYTNISPEIAEIKNANFVASVYQDNKKVADFPITGCNQKQPFVFGGYAIPGFDKKIVLLLSAKGDCWEGGYIYESLNVVGGVNNLDKTYLSNFYKGPSALVPNEGTLVVYVSASLEPDAPDWNNPKWRDNPTETDTDGIGNLAIPYTIGLIILFVGLGYSIGRRVKK